MFCGEKEIDFLIANEIIINTLMTIICFVAFCVQEVRESLQIK
jgi:hypothetical protein